MTSLRELSTELMEVQALALDPEIPPEALQDTLDAMEGMFNEKALRVVHVITNSGSDVDAIDVEIKRLQDRKKIISNAQSRLKDYLQFNMEATGTTKISGPLFTITLAKGREVAIVDDQDELPEDYTITKTTVSPVKAIILKALKEGVEVPGAHIERNPPTVRIK